MKLIKTLSVAMIFPIFYGYASESISKNDYNHMISITECAFITTIVKPGILPQKTIDNTFNKTISVFKKNTALMRKSGYNPTPQQLTIDFAVYYQQVTSDIYDEMFASLKAEGLQLTPQSWFTIGIQYWVLKDCQSIIKK